MEQTTSWSGVAARFEVLGKETTGLDEIYGLCMRGLRGFQRNEVGHEVAFANECYKGEKRKSAEAKKRMTLPLLVVLRKEESVEHGRGDKRGRGRGGGLADAVIHNSKEYRSALQPIHPIHPTHVT